MCYTYKRIRFYTRKADKMKKIIAFALVLIFCLTIVSCSDGEAPDGMYLVSGSHEPFKLYVPENWTDNRASGISPEVIARFS